MNIIRMTVPLEIKQVGEENSEHFTFEGFASTFGNVDLHDDVIVEGAFRETLPQRVPKLLWQHQGDEPLGVFVEIREMHQGLFVKGIMPKSDTFVSGRVIPQMKIGSVNQMSIGFFIEDFDRDIEIRDGIRFIKRLVLLEISLVSIPANDHARVLAVKSATSFQDLPLADRDRPWDANFAKSRVRAWVGAEDGLDTPAIQRKYRGCFFWYDQSEPDVFASYKLPFTDIIEGRQVAVPRGIFAAAAAMQGARGGVDIPEADRPAVRRHIERYYDKMGLDSPFDEQRAFRIDDVTVLADERILERLLSNGVRFSQKTAKTLTSILKPVLQRDAAAAGHCDGELSEETCEKAIAVFDNITNKEE